METNPKNMLPKWWIDADESHGRIRLIKKNHRFNKSKTFIGITPTKDVMSFWWSPKKGTFDQKEMNPCPTIAFLGDMLVLGSHDHNETSTAYWPTTTDTIPNKTIHLPTLK